MLIGITHEDIIANILCFVSGLSFGYYLANLKKDSNSSKQLNDELIFLVQRDNNTNKNNHYINQ